MSNRSYPRKMSPTFSTTANRPGCTHCDTCKKAFSSGEVYAVVEVQTGWFRGDDEVFLYCNPCGTKAGIVFPHPKLKCPTCGKLINGERGMMDHTKAKHSKDIV